MPILSERIDGVAVELSVRPRAGRCRVRGVSGGRLRVEVTAAPEDGEATRQALSTLASALGIPARNIFLLVGTHDRHKVVLVRGVPLKKCEELVASATSEK